MRSVALVFAGLVLASGFAACGDDGPQPPPDSPYADALTHPDSLIHDLMLSYERREIEPYANLLARDFRFFFQEEDVTPGIPLGFWNFGEDSTGTGALFRSDYVLDIRVDLAWDPPVEATLEGRPARRVLVSDTGLDVDQSNGVVLRVDGDRQEFHFRAGREDLGEDPGRLYLWWWADLGRSAGRGTLGPRGPLVQPVTWGSIKMSFN